jgi:hypothetical protein
MKSPAPELDAQVDHAELVQKFLLGVQDRRKVLKARAAETAKGFARSKRWEQALQRSSLLGGQAGAAPPPCNDTNGSDAVAASAPLPVETSAPGPEAASAAAAVLATPEKVEGSVSTTASDSRPGLSASDISILSLSTGIDSELSDFLPFSDPSSQQLGQPIRAVNDEAARSSPTYEPSQQLKHCAPRTLLMRDAPNPFGDGRSEKACSLAPATSLPPSLADQMHFAVQAVLASTTHTFEIERHMVAAFEPLRKIAVHAAQMPADETRELLDGQAEHAAAVLTFLVDIVSGRPLMRSSQVCEVLDILLQHRSWQKAARGCPALLDKIQSISTPPQVQVCFEKIPKAKQSVGQRARSRLQRLIICGCGSNKGQGGSSAARSVSKAGVASGA